LTVVAPLQLYGGEHNKPNVAAPWLPEPTQLNEWNAMSEVLITVGPFVFNAQFEAAAPKTVQVIRRLLPYEQRVIHVRWSGEAVWVPLGDTDLGLPKENQTSYPAPGQVLVYPGGKSETEILLAYGGVKFSSKVGQLAGNHFLTITSPLEDLAKLGKLVLWEGAQPIRIEAR
jgi:hypothetical protein